MLKVVYKDFLIFLVFFIIIILRFDFMLFLLFVSLSMNCMLVIRFLCLRFIFYYVFWICFSLFYELKLLLIII